MSRVGIEAATPQPAGFQFTEVNCAEAGRIVRRYPAGRQSSAVMPLLDLAQRQNGGWLPRAAMDAVAQMLGMPPVKVYEVATFYSMYNLTPIGRFHIQVCTTTPCWLRGSDDIVRTLTRHLETPLGGTSRDGLFTITEVECLGACVNAPMMQINDDTYEDLTSDSARTIVNTLREGGVPRSGSQTGRRGSCPAGGPTTLAAFTQADVPDAAHSPAGA